MIENGPPAGLNVNAITSSGCEPVLSIVNVLVTEPPAEIVANEYSLAGVTPSGVSVISPSWSPVAAVVSRATLISAPASIKKEKSNGFSSASLLANESIPARIPPSSEKYASSSSAVSPGATD